MNFNLFVFSFPEIPEEEKEVPTPRKEEVFGAPRFITTLQKHIDVTEGSDVKLECVVEGTPLPEITWYLVGI